VSAMWIRLRRNWFRNSLAVLQVALAIAAVSAALVDVVPLLTDRDAPGATQYWVRFGAQGGDFTVWTSAFFPDDVTYLLDHATAVEAASAYQNEFQTVVMVDGERWLVRAKANVHPAFAELVNLELTAGTFFTEQDALDTAPRVVVISEQLAQMLFGTTDVVGRTINVRPREEAFLLRGFPSARSVAELMALPGDDVTIIGVYRVRDPLLMMSLGPMADLLLPFTAAAGPGPGMLLSEILYRPRPGMEREAEEEVRRLLTARLAERGEMDRTIEGMRPEVLIGPAAGSEQLRQARASGSLLIGGLGLVALIVSSIAMFTTTLANLAPRTRYIGLSRALGATRARIVREVVTESAVLAGIGGLVGVALAFPLRTTVLAPLLISAALGLGKPGFVDVLLAGLASVALAMIVGALAALYPAWTVARLAPAEAWREGTS